ELLPIDGDAALARRFKGAVRMLGAREELVKLEGEEAAGARVRSPRARLLGRARHEQKVAQGLATDVGGAVGGRSQLLHRLGDGHRTGPFEALITLGPRRA